MYNRLSMRRGGGNINISITMIIRRKLQIMTKNKNQMGFAHIGLILLAFFVIAAIGGVGYYTLQKSKDKSSTPKRNDTSAPTATSDTKETESNTAAAMQEIPVNKSVNNGYGFTITVNKAIRNFQDDDLEANEEGVLVEVTIEADGTYTGTPGKSSFRILADGGSEIKTAYLITGSDLDKAGYTPLPFKSATKGQPVTGFVAYAVPKGSKTLVFRYTRPVSKILGGSSVPEKSFDIKIL